VLVRKKKVWSLSTRLSVVAADHQLRDLELVGDVPGAAQTELLKLPRMATTLSWVISLRTALTPSEGCERSSSLMTSILRPSTPPLAFTSVDGDHGALM